MLLLWSSCWYFYLGVPAAGSDSTVRDLLDGTSTNSDRLSTSKACHSSWTCTTFLHRPIGMFLKGFGNCRGHLVTLSHLKAAYYSVSKILFFFTGRNDDADLSSWGFLTFICRLFWHKLRWHCLTCPFQVAAPSQPTASPAGFNAQANFLSTDVEPTFELKGSNFLSAPPLSSDSTSADVYTSDKLNFLWALCRIVRNRLIQVFWSLLEHFHTHIDSWKTQKPVKK